MPAGQGQISTLSDTTTTKRAIAAVIKNITPRDIPCCSYFGLDNGGKFGVQNLPNNRYEWLEDTLRVRTAVTITPAVSGTTAAISVTAGQGILFRPGDVWQAPAGDLFWVSSVNTGTDIVTGIPNWGALGGGAQGTWTATIAIGSTLTYKYSARPEGADSDPSPYTAISNPYNLSHIMQAEIRVTGSEQDATTRYGVSNQFQYQLEKWLGGKGAGNGQQGRAGDLMIDLENTFFSGVRVARATNTTAGAMGGFPFFVTTNVSHNSGVPRYLTQRILEDQLQNIWALGGMPDVIICNAFQKRQINSFYTGSIRTDRNEKTGGAIINAVETDFGVIDLMLTRRADTNKIYIAQKDKVGWVALRKFFVHDLAISGDYTRKEILGEYGFIVQNEQCHGIIKDLATS